MCESINSVHKNEHKLVISNRLFINCKDIKHGAGELCMQMYVMWCGVIDERTSHIETRTGFPNGILIDIPIFSCTFLLLEL